MAAEVCLGGESLSAIANERFDTEMCTMMPWKFTVCQCDGRNRSERELTFSIWLRCELVGAKMAAKPAWVDTTFLCFQRGGRCTNCVAHDHSVEIDVWYRLADLAWITERRKQRVVVANRPHGSAEQCRGECHFRGMVPPRFLTPFRSDPGRIHRGWG